MDSLGYRDIGCYGAKDIQTPHLDRLADEGVLLTQCYSNGAVCTPSRAALMSGLYPGRVGLENPVVSPGSPNGLSSSEVVSVGSVRTQRTTLFLGLKSTSNTSVPRTKARYARQNSARI